jgi:hypothetical protein
MSANANQNSNVILRVSVQIEPILVRKDVAAQMLGMSPRTFDDLMLAGLISKVKIGGLTLFAVNELRAFAEQIPCEGLMRDKIAAMIEANRTNRRASPVKS